MANPIFIPIAFAANGIKNLIQKVRQVGQDPEDFTWDEGAPLITMTKIEDGGKAPKGQDVNGVLNALSEHVIYGQNGNRYTWSQDVVDEFGGYALGVIIQSDDTTKEFRSLVANNTVNPNNELGGAWEVYSGQGSIPTATSTTAGITKVLNVLNSSDVGSALSANMGRSLLESIDLKLDKTGNAASATKLSTASGPAPSYSARAWVNFNGANGSIRSSENIQSVVRNATGNYTVTFLVTMPHANYSPQTTMSSFGAGAGFGVVSQTATSITLQATYGGDNTIGNFDPSICSLVIFC